MKTQIRAWYTLYEFLNVIIIFSLKREIMHDSNDVGGVRQSEDLTSYPGTVEPLNADTFGTSE